jgi:hypothetical protein
VCWMTGEGGRERMLVRRGNEFSWPPANEVYKDERARTEMDTRREFWVARASLVPPPPPPRDGITRQLCVIII